MTGQPSQLFLVAGRKSEMPGNTSLSFALHKDYRSHFIVCGGAWLHGSNWVDLVHAYRHTGYCTVTANTQFFCLICSRIKDISCNVSKMLEPYRQCKRCCFSLAVTGYLHVQYVCGVVLHASAYGDAGAHSRNLFVWFQPLKHCIHKWFYCPANHQKPRNRMQKINH